MTALDGRNPSEPQALACAMMPVAMPLRGSEGPRGLDRTSGPIWPLFLRKYMPYKHLGGFRVCAIVATKLSFLLLTLAACVV